MSDEGPGAWPPPSPGGTFPPSPSAPSETPPWRPPVSTDPAREAWWRRRAAGVPVGGWIVVGLLALAGIGAAGLALDGDDGGPKMAIDVPANSVAAVGRAPSGAGSPAAGRTAGSNPGTGSAHAPVTVPGGAPTSAPASATTLAEARRGSGAGSTGSGSTGSGSTGSDSPGSGSTGSGSPGSDSPGSGSTGSDSPGGDGSTPDAPLPAGDPSVSTFEYRDMLGAEWSGTIHGVVEVPLFFDDDAGERCFVVVGTVTPRAADGLVSDAWSTPYVTLFVDGREAELGTLACDPADVDAAGYRSLFDANATIGTEFAFYAEFSLAESIGAPDAIAVGQPNEAWRFFEARLLDAVAPVEPGPVGALAIDPEPIDAASPGAFRHTDDYTGDVWSGTIAGLVEVPLDQYSARDGRCFAVVGTLTADATSGAATSNAYAAPPIALIADGRLLDDYFGCSYVEAEDAGYAWFTDTEITPGTTVAVFATVSVPPPFPGTLQAIVVGDPWSDQPAVLAPRLLDDFPPAHASPGPPPAGTLTAVGEPHEIVEEYDEATWTVVIHGLQPVAAVDAPGDCLVVYATATPVEAPPDDTPPEINVIAGGRLLSESFGCDTQAAVTAGYVDQWREPARPGASVHVYAAFRIPPPLGAAQAIIVGAEPTEQLLVAPTAIDAIPAISR